MQCYLHENGLDRQLYRLYRGIKRYSERTVRIYSDVPGDFREYLDGEDLIEALCPSVLRSYEVHLLEERKLSARTVGQHLSVLSSFCKYLYKKGLLSSNPLRSIRRPKTEKSLPIFYRQESMHSYFESTAFYASEEALDLERSEKLLEMVCGKEFGKIFLSGTSMEKVLGIINKFTTESICYKVKNGEFSL